MGLLNGNGRFILWFMTKAKQIPLPDFIEYEPAEMQQRAADFYADIKRRRTVRHFSERPVARQVLEDCLRAAGTAPNGANMQPWHFVVVEDITLKQRIRAAAEAEEQAFYEGRAPADWLAALAPLGTDAHKPFLETAPYLIVIFAQSYGIDKEGNRVKHYYVQESVGIATGILITALHRAGLATLTHTPSPMGFLNELLARPKWERPFLILVVGYPAAEATVPNISKKPLEEIVTFL
jgi:iodotyrosine deiodinase